MDLDDCPDVVGGGRLPDHMRQPVDKLFAYHRIVFLGPPGTGKGTQAQRLCKSLKLAHFCTGDLLRASIKNETEVGRLAKPFMDEGNLVPDDVVIKMVLEAILSIHPPYLSSDQAAVNFSGFHGFLLDGFPRTVPQAGSLGACINKVVLIETPADVIEKRLSGRRICAIRDCSQVYNLDSNPPKIAFTCDKCGGVLIQRSDDMPEVIQQRQKRYWADTSPLIEYYKKAGLLTSVDGTKPMDEVFAAIMAAISSEKKSDAP